MDCKEKIINIFNRLKSKTIIKKNPSDNCGYYGYQLESFFGISKNCKNEPDFLNFELKKFSKKITLGDFSASEYLFSKNKEYINSANNFTININKSDFIQIFGNLNKKKNRYSWSGGCIPFYGEYNKCGQILEIDTNGNIIISYDYEYDKRTYKVNFPDIIKTHKIIITIWFKKKLEACVNNKYNANGFIICKMNKKSAKYDKLYIGKPFDYKVFLDNIKDKNIVFDSGMYDGNSRNYSHFRATFSNFWKLHIIEEHY